VNFKQDRAIYLQIADYITENILSGKWKESDRIPSVRDLAVSIEVNPNTVAHTYNYLQELGIVYNQRGIGYFIAKDARQNTRELEKDAFIKDQLPNVFKTMMLLNISIDDICHMYKEYKKLNAEGEIKPGVKSDENDPSLREET